MNWIEYRIKEAREKQLPELDLSLGWRMNKLEDSLDVLTEFPTSILELTHLTKLDLSGHALKVLPKEIYKLSNLKELSLSRNSGIQLPNELARLPHLTHLNLSWIRPLTPVDFAALQNLQVLDISYNDLQFLPTGILKLKNLNELVLDGNHFKAFPAELQNLLSLTSLSIGISFGAAELKLSNGDLAGFSRNMKLKELQIGGVKNIGVLDELAHLKSLERLSILGTELEVIPDGWLKLPRLKSFGLEDTARLKRTTRNIRNIHKLVELNELEELSLPNTSLVDCAGMLSNMKSLKRLTLNHFSVGKIFDEILELRELETVSLIDCDINYLPSEIGKLQKLQGVNLSRNPLVSLPEEIGSLEKLERLWLAITNLTGLPASFKNLKNLKALSLHGAKLREWPMEVLALDKLHTLVLSETGINEIPPSLSRLKHLVELDLSLNQIQSIPGEIRFLPVLNNLILDGNPITNPPPEIVARGTAAIQGYFSALQDSEASRLFEAKLIIVGEGEVGKTCLAQKLVDPGFDILRDKEKIDTTRGIEIKDWRIETPQTDDFKINIWDFGGQEIYHATHQFFLTKRSLYVFVWDARKEDRLGGFDYWLNAVKLLSDNSPVLVVLNKADSRIKEIDQRVLKTKFENVASFHKVSALTGYGMPELTRDIKATIVKLPHVGDKWPGSWSRVRKILEAEVRDYIDHEEYLRICESEGLSRSQADLLSTYLHDLGVILHFQDDPVLQKIVILKPEWGTNAVYAVLDTKKIQRSNGRFSFKDLGGIWSQTSYPASKHAELLQLMIRFELCFQLSGDKYYIAPELLSNVPPSFSWDDTDNLRFEYHYAFMPAGIVTRFIARNHELIESSLYWRNGVVLSWENSKALITSEPLNRKIRVAVVGADKKGLLSIIRREFSYIHKTLNNPDAAQMIPCTCDECRLGEPFFFEYQRLLKYLEKGQTQIICDKSINRVDIHRLLADVFNIKELAGQAVAAPSRTFYVQNYYETPGADMTTTEKEQRRVKSPWSSGSFYLLAVVVLIALLAAVGKFVSFWILPVIIVGGLLLITVIGAFQLKADQQLSDKKFLELMELSFQQLPLVGKLAKPHSNEISK